MLGYCIYKPMDVNFSFDWQMLKKKKQLITFQMWHFTIAYIIYRCLSSPIECYLGMNIICKQLQIMCSPSAMTAKMETAGSHGLESNYVAKMSNLF